MPGIDILETTKVVFDSVDLPFLPELPARGAPAGMIGRTLGLISELGADLQPDGWRVGVGEGVDQRRSRSLIAQDLDTVEEWADGYSGPFKIQVTGPLTLAASVEQPRGEKMLADHGARRELAEALVIGLSAHVADVQRRLPNAQLWVQIDEPSVRAVLDGQVPTASGYRRYRRVDAPEADELLRRVSTVVRESGARSVVHSCAPQFPVDLVHGAGFDALSFDLSLAPPSDAWSAAFDAGVNLWPGAIPTSAVASAVSEPAQIATRIERFFAGLGFGPDDYADRLVVTPSCGLAGLPVPVARGRLGVASEAARRAVGDEAIAAQADTGVNSDR